MSSDEQRKMLFINFIAKFYLYKSQSFILALVFFNQHLQEKIIH